MKHKKLVSSLLALSLPMGAVLAGCGSDDSSNASNTSSPAASAGATAAATVNPADLKPVELSFYYSGGSEQKDQAAVEAKLNELLKPKINATIKLYPVDYGSWAQKINLMVAGNEPFDLIFTAASDGFSAKAAAGNFLELNSLLDKYGQDIKKSIDPVMLQGSQINGKYFAVPVQKEIAAHQGVVLHKGMVDKYGFDISKIKTLKDLEPMLQTIKEKEPATVVPFWGTGNIPVFAPFEYIGNRNVPGAIAIGKDTTVFNQWDTPEIREIYELMRSWNQKGFFQKDPTTQTDASAYVKAGTLFAQWQSLKPGKDKEMSASRNYEFVQVDITTPYVAATGPAGAMTSISRTSKNPERAMMLLNLLHSDKEILNTLVMGIEGTHYTKVSDNVVKKTDQAANYAPGINWKIGNQFLNYLYDNEDPQKWEKFQAYNKSAQVSPLLGFTYDATNVKNEESAIVNIYKEYNDGLGTGVLDPAKALPEYIEKLKKAGMDKVIAEKQKQVDEFLKNKK
ncbi:ABC transporter substrate-binding protein [Paenibacillus sp. YN15]|uniref:ABC transporter substrate-binding protein n=1 Tax=Paenibacillus sp. YN15 TaxID=1742774 RepID=UPI000DCCFC96|nr:ABC transporter substrate-binding protein [Paenibacillus sp. YN15]RAU92346.1 sugar ABC transporter substrate-binding protein [Paenibacillus sp. YN15]